ncbi:unnamed protein product [Calypogeia fissa]
MAGYDPNSLNPDNAAIVLAASIGDSTAELQGNNSKNRAHRKGMWTVAELLVMQASRREDFERQAKGGIGEKHRSAQERWRWIEDQCWAAAVKRSAAQCQDKWECIAAEFKKVSDYEKSIPPGQPSYWHMGSDDKKKYKLPPNFHEEVFLALRDWYGKTNLRSIDPGTILFDTPAPNRAGGPELLAGGYPGNSGAANMDFSGSLGAESDDNDTGRSSKRRKSMFKMAESLAAVLERNNKNMIAALRESEKRKDIRHQKTLDFEREKMKASMDLQLQLGNGYIGALAKIGDGLDKIGSAMWGQGRP